MVPIQSIISSGESDNDMYDGIHDRRLEVWKERGFDVDGEAAAADAFGSSVSVSDDGHFVAIGAPKNDASKQEGWKVLSIFSGSTLNGRPLRGTENVSQ